MIPRHEQFLDEVLNFGMAIGCKVGAPSAYHDILPAEEKLRMAKDYSMAGLAVRLRADRRLWHPSGAGFIPVDAKTSPWHLQFPVEALQIGFHVSDHDQCLLVMRSHGKRNMDRGLIVTSENVAQYISEIRIPTGFPRFGKVCERRKFAGLEGYPNVPDDVDFYSSAFAKMFPGIPIHVVSHSNGSGDPFAVFDTVSFESLPHWQDVIKDWALER
jgi:hypothetical protein